MNSKRLFAILLTTCMLLTLFAACSSEEEPENIPTDNPPVVTDGTDDPSDTPQEIVEFNFWIPDDGNMPDIDKVEAAMNAILETEVGVHVNFEPIATADFSSQLTLAVANNEPVDLARIMYFGSTTWANLYSQGYMMDMKELVEEYGQDLRAVVGDDILAALQVDGGQYGIPAYRTLNSNVYAYFRTDVLKEVGALEKFQVCTTWSEYEEILQMIADNSEIVNYAVGGSVPESVVYDNIGVNGDAFSDIEVWDWLGDSTKTIWSDAEGHVGSTFDQESVVEKFKMVKRWFDAGWVYSDSAYNNDQPATQVGYGIFAGMISQSEFGVEVTKKNQTGVECTALEIAKELIPTSKCKSIGVFIPATAEEPEAAMKFLNALYTNADLMNLFIWGIEGENYVIEDGVAKYPEGKDGSTCGYHQNDFAYGNQFLVMPWDGSIGGAEFRELAKENFLAADLSPYFGLTVDMAGQDTLLSNISAVTAEYYHQLSNGLYSDELYAECMEKLEAADIGAYIALYQAAVDGFAA